LNFKELGGGNYITQIDEVSRFQHNHNGFDTSNGGSIVILERKSKKTQNTPYAGADSRPLAAFTAWLPLSPQKSSNFDFKFEYFRFSNISIFDPLLCFDACGLARYICGDGFIVWPKQAGSKMVRVWVRFIANPPIRMARSNHTKKSFTIFPLMT